jgi:DNA modification methylase
VKKYKNDFVLLGDVINDKIDDLRSRFGIGSGSGIDCDDNSGELKIIANDNLPDDCQIESYLSDKVVKGDCYRLLEGLKENSIDLIVTDPPYVLNSGSSSFSGCKLYGSDKLSEICNGYDIDRFFDLCSRVLKKVNIFAFCSNAQIPDILNWARKNNLIYNVLIWHKTNAIPFCKYSWKPDIEYIIHIREKGACFNGYDSKICSKVYSSVTNPSKFGHPTEKPLPLLSKLISVASNQNDIILDPFLGSGSTIIACQKLNRKVFGFEIKEEYCDIVKKRVKDLKKQMDFFIDMDLNYDQKIK